MRDNGGDSNNDSDIDAIEREFKHQPGLSYSLLRMVNLDNNGSTQKINSIRHAIKLMGRQQLQKWIQLLLYTSHQPENSASNAITHNAIARGRSMELIAAVDRPHDKNHQERAFMVGILSLLDKLLGMEMEQIVDKLAISDDMNQALLTRHGRLGRALKLIEAKEQGEIASIEAMLPDLGFLTLHELSQIETQAMKWVNRVDETIN
jgi:EAL and modified HD-GYP domain-containing signal transduction protein